MPFLRGIPASQYSNRKAFGSVAVFRNYSKLKNTLLDTLNMFQQIIKLNRPTILLNKNKINKKNLVFSLSMIFEITMYVFLSSYRKCCTSFL